VRRFLKLATVAAAALMAAGLAYLVLTLPPRAAVLPDSPPGIAYGAYHVHSARSDGSGTVDEIAAAASRAGLTFVILTDHDVGTRPPDPPTYRHGVLCVDAIEIGSTGGHVVALNLQRASDYPLGGDTRDVIEDVHRMGGWAVAAHPDSPRDELRWRASGAIDGIEWLNADSEWRDERTGRLLASLGRLAVRPAESIAALFNRPIRSLARWDAAARMRPVVGLAAVDAHARIDWSGNAEPRGGKGWAVPSYESSFRSLAQAVQLEAPLTGRAGEDARQILTAIVNGRTYSVVRAFADPGVLEFSGERDGRRVEMGDSIDHGPLTFRATTPGVLQSTVVLLKDGRQVATGQGSVTAAASDPGVYRAEATFPGFAFPWIVSNPIRVGLATGTRPSPDPPPPPARQLQLGPGTAWVIEKDGSSTGRVEKDRDGIRFTYRLGPGPVASQYAAIATSASGDQAIDRIRFTAQSERPMRLSVQIRTPGGTEGRRWRRSIYLDQTPRVIDLALSELEPVGSGTALRPVVARVQSVLLVVDTVNAAPGASGSVRISRLLLGLGDPQRP
jgi:predicted metal-dependent phosphoesterase TrpH